jgi:hypothetical protein
LAILAGRHELTFVDMRQEQRSATRSKLSKIVSVTAVHGPDPLIVAADESRLWSWYAHDFSKAWDWPHPEPVRAVVGLPEQADFLVTLDADGVLRRWDIRSGTAAEETAETGVVRAAGTACFQDKDGVVVAIGGNGVVQRWRCRPRGLPDWTRLPDVDCTKLPRAICAVSRVEQGNAGRLFVVTADRILCQPGASGEAWSRDEPGPDAKAACAWRDGEGRVRLAVGAESGRISLYDGADGRLIRTIPTGLGINSLTAMADNGQRSLIIGAREGAVVIDLHEATGALE